MQAVRMRVICSGGGGSCGVRCAAAAWVTRASGRAAPLRAAAPKRRAAAPAPACGSSSGGGPSGTSSSGAPATRSSGGLQRVALGAAAACAALALAATPPALADEGVFELPYAKPVVTTESSPRAVALAKRLKAEGAALKAAFWCSHCFEQEQLFGKQAMEFLPVTECFPDGWRRGVEMEASCAALPVRAFPTWVFPNGAIVEGEMSFDALEAVLDGKDLAATAAAP